MRRGLFALVALAVVSVASTSGVMLSGAIFNNAASNTQTASAAADFVAPTATASVVARVNANKPGFIQQNQQFVVYANVTDAGNPASGVSTVTANLSSFDTASGSTSVALTACSSGCTLNGVPYSFKSAAQTSDGNLSQGSKSYSLTTTDGASNTRSGQNFSVTIDNTAPTVSSVLGAQGSGTPGSVHAGGTYFLYADASDANGIDTIGGDVSAITSSQSTPVALSTCSTGCAIGGHTYALKSGPLTADGGLSDGATPGFSVTAADIAGNSTTDSHNATIDNSTPSITGATIVKSTGGADGSIHQGGGYFVLANVTDTTGTFDAITANVSAITTAQTSPVALTACSTGCTTPNGTTYAYKSAPLTATNSLSAGSKAFSVNASDAAGNSATQFNGSVTVDNTAPTATDVQTTNAGTAGLPEANDTIVFSTSKQLDPASVLAGWDGTQTNVVVHISTHANKSSLTVFNSTDTTQLNLGTVALGGEYTANNGSITFGATGTASHMVQSGSTITITLGTLGGTAVQDTGTNTMSWAPASGTTGATDPAGNALSAAVSETGTADEDF